MAIALNVHSSVAAWDTAMHNHTAVNWQKRNPDAWRVVCDWIKLEDARRKGK